MRLVLPGVEHHRAFNLDAGQKTRLYLGSKCYLAYPKGVFLRFDGLSRLFVGLANR